MILIDIFQKDNKMDLQREMLAEQENKIEIILRRVGGQNKYQLILFLIFALKWLIAAMILFSLNFFYFVPEFTCTQAEMADYGTCEDFVCSYDDEQFWVDHLKQPVKPSISLDYGYVMTCNNQWMSSLLQSMSYLGSLIGYMIMSHVADNYGRKKGEYISWAICIAGQILLLVSFDVSMVGIGSFFMGFGANGAITIHYSFFKELALGKTRERMIVAIQLAFSVGISIISLLSYLIDTWKYTLGFFIILPSFGAMLFFKLVEQTPEFTLKKGVQNFIRSFDRIAEINQTPKLDPVEVRQQLKNYATSSEQNEVSYMDLFRYNSLRKIALVTGAVNFSVEFIYDGTLLSLDKFGFNVYFNQMLVGLVQVFAALFGVYIVPRVQRKRYVTVSLIIISVICTGMGIESLTYDHQSNEFNYHVLIEMILIAFLRFVISSLWGVLFVYVSELYPNEVSSLSYGWVSIIGTVGASISPYVRLATANMTMFIMAILAFTMSILIRTLEETKGKGIRTRILERQKEASGKENIHKKSSILEDDA